MIRPLPSCSNKIHYRNCLGSSPNAMWTVLEDTLGFTSSAIVAVTTHPKPSLNWSTILEVSAGRWPLGLSAGIYWRRSFLETLTPALSIILMPIYHKFFKKRRCCLANIVDSYEKKHDGTFENFSSTEEVMLSTRSPKRQRLTWWVAFRLSLRTLLKHSSGWTSSNACSIQSSPCRGEDRKLCKTSPTITCGSSRAWRRSIRGTNRPRKTWTSTCPTWWTSSYIEERFWAKIQACMIIILPVSHCARNYWLIQGRRRLTNLHRFATTAAKLCFSQRQAILACPRILLESPSCERCWLDFP